MKQILTALLFLSSLSAYAYTFEIGEQIYITEARWVHPVGSDSSCMLMPIQDTEVVAINGDEITMELVDGRDPKPNGDCEFGTRFVLPAHLADTLRSTSLIFYNERLEMYEILKGRSPTKSMNGHEIGERFTFMGDWRWINIEATTHNSNHNFEPWDLCRAYGGATFSIMGFVVSTKKAFVRYEYSGNATDADCPDGTLFLVKLSDLEPI